MEDSNKRIVKNTLYLYIRTFVIMILSFITTKIVLDKLGQSDYGVYNLVGGFVAMFTILNSILNTGTSRFIALYIGKGNKEKLQRTFTNAVFIHLAIGIIIVLLLESLGIWFLNNKLNIEPTRMVAANWIFQFSVLTTFLSVIQTPYSAAVTAHEKFNIYAAMSIYDVIAKLAILFLLVYIPGDKLIIYGALLLMVSAISIIIYRIYCIQNFKECNWSTKTDKAILKEMLTFSGWTALGNVISNVNSQGISILLNIFFNTIMNAARGLATTVNFTISQFISGFMTASQPQLVKYYGTGDMQRFNKLIFNVSQYSLFLVAFVAVPVIMEIDYVLKLWLGNNVPPYTADFIRITMICSLVYKGNGMIESGIIAIGRMKELNTWSIPFQLITLPLTYISLKCGFSPATTYWFISIPPTCCFIVNIILLSRMINFQGWRFFNKIFLKTILLVLLSCVIPYIVREQMEEGLIRFIVVCLLSVICTIVIMWFYGLNSEVKQLMIEKIKLRLKRFNKWQKF